MGAAVGEGEVEASEKEKAVEGKEDQAAADGEEAAKEELPEVTNAELAGHIVNAMVRVATGQEGYVMLPHQLRQEMAHNSLVRFQCNFTYAQYFVVCFCA